MNRPTALIAIACSLAFLSGCDDGNTKEIKNDLLVKCWAHSFEEDANDGPQTYRPCATHTFPQARYRNTFTLHEDHKVEYSVLSLNDAHTTEEGKWSYNGRAGILEFTGPEGKVVKKYQVETVAEDKLVVHE